MNESKPPLDNAKTSQKQSKFDLVAALKEIRVLGSSEPWDSPVDARAVDSLLAAMHDPETRSAFVAQLFPGGIPLDESFFRRLTEVRRCIGVANRLDQANRIAQAIGIIWSEAVAQVPPAEKQQLLTIFSKQAAHCLFENIDSLPVVVENHELPPGFCANWFADLLRAVERDILQDGVWATIRTLCISRERLAIDVLWSLSTPPDPHRLNIAGFMLGTLRAHLSDTQLVNEFGRVERFFESHADYPCRAVFNWSWVSTARTSGIASEQIELLFERAKGGQDDLSNIICVICQLRAVVRLPTELTSRCDSWLSEHVTSSLSPDAKFYVARAVELMTEEPVEDGGRPRDLSEWLLGIQPVDQDNLGTWGRISDCLCRMLNRDPKHFCDIFQRLCRSSAATIHHLMDNRALERLTHAMHRPDVEELIGQLAVSVDTATRKLGLYLFDLLEISEFPKTAFTSNGDSASRLLFYETQRTMLDPKSIARLLVAVVPFAEVATDGFREELFDELKLQSHNFSGACRTELKSLAHGSPMVAKAIEEVEQYFKALDHAHRTGINAMEVAGHRRAVVQYERLFARRVSKNADSLSPFLSMTKRVTMPYGRHVSWFIDGKLAGPMPLTHTSTSMELPIVDFCDPEEMALRRLNASSAINSLVARYQKDRPSEGVSRE